MPDFETPRAQDTDELSADELDDVAGGAEGTNNCNCTVNNCTSPTPGTSGLVVV